MDQDWRELSNGSERLRWARYRWLEKAGAIRNSARAAAESMGMKYSTYAQYEREEGAERHAPLTVDRAKEFGKKFKVSWSWLITGMGSPDGVPEAGPLLRINNIAQTLSADDQEKAARLLESVFLNKAS